MNIILYLFLSFIISLFTMFYYQIKHKFISFLSLSFILFLSLLLFRNEHIIVIYLSLFLEINLFLHITHQTDTSEHFIMTTLLFITLMIAKISAISLFLLLTSYSLNDVLKNTNYLNFMQLIECLIFSLFCIQIYLLKIKNILKIYNSKKQDIQFFLFSIFILLSLIVQSIYNASFPSKTLFLLSLLLIVSFLFILCIYERIKTIVEDNNELLLNEQKQKYSLLNKNTIMKSNDEIKRLEHRMLYSLMQIKNQIKEKNYDNVIYSIDEYLNKIKYNKYSIITNNPYFDYVFCQLIDQLNQKNIVLRLFLLLIIFQS